MTDQSQTLADVADHAIDRLYGGAAELAKAVKQVAPHAWEVAVRQQVIDGWVTIAENAVVLLIIISLSILVCRKGRSWHDAILAASQRKRGERVGDATGFWIGLAVATILSLLCGGAAIGSIGDAAMRVANPEFYAAKALIEAAK